MSHKLSNNKYQKQPPPGTKTTPCPTTARRSPKQWPTFAGFKRTSCQSASGATHSSSSSIRQQLLQPLHQCRKNIKMWSSASVVSRLLLRHNSRLLRLVRAAAAARVRTSLRGCHLPPSNSINISSLWPAPQNTKSRSLILPHSMHS